MEKPNQTPRVDTLTLQLRESIKYELLKRENRLLKEQVARLRQELKKTKDSETFIRTIKNFS